MIKEAIGTGATVEEALENAIATLGAGDNDNIQHEIITLPKEKFLGLFGGRAAEVRVFVEMPDEKPKKKNNNKNINRNKNENRQKNNQNAAKPVEKKPEKAVNKTEAPTKQENQNPAKTEKVAESAPVTTAVDEYANAVDSTEIAPDSSAGRAVAYLFDILSKLGCTNITAKVAERANGALIIIDGDGLGVVIGHRGETLDALQYLAGLSANSGAGYYKVSLNIGSYREKREQTLNALASRVSEQVIRTGRSRALEPMNPYERRIIHTAVQGIEGVISNSVGEGASRRVVIATEGSDIQAVKNEHSGRRGRHSGRGGRSGHGRDRKPSNTVATVPSREPKKDSDMPLYGKIN